jgi:hypothetical protein
MWSSAASSRHVPPARVYTRLAAAALVVVGLLVPGIAVAWHNGEGPTMPSGFRVTAAGPTSITLAWNASTDPDGVGGYKVSRNWSRLGTTQSTTYAFAELSCGKTYTLTVQAYDRSDNNSQPASISASSGACSAGNPPSASPTPTPPPSSPVNASPPSLAGLTREGETLTASPGNWSGTAPITYAYQWLRCDLAGANCAVIAGAASSSYRLTLSDASHTMRVRVTAANAAGNASATSAASAVVTRASSSPVAPPVNTTRPSISGTPQAGQALTASTGTWTGSPTSYAYRWQRCASTGTACSDVAGVTGRTYLLVAADVGSRMRVVVTASNGGGSSSASSDATLAVTAAASQPPSGGGGSVVLVDRSWSCTGPVNLDLVKVTMRTAIDDAIHLRPGCSGRIGRVEIDTWTADGIKVNPERQPVPQDIVVGGGYIRCHQRAGSIHQDGVQVMGGQRLSFRNLEISCTTAGNAQFFVQAAVGGYPADVVCDGCFLGPGASTTLRIEASARSGARNTLICRGRYFWSVFESSAVSPINSLNTNLSTSDPRCQP